MIPATAPIQRRADARLLVIDEQGAISDHPRVNFPNFTVGGDVVIANDAATLPASLAGIHAPTGAVIELRLAGIDALLPEAATHFKAVVFGSGDFRTPTERRSRPPSVQAGDVLHLGPLTAVVTATLAHPRLVDVHFQNSIAEIWAAFARYGRPIQYAYVPEPLSIRDTWTRIASRPVAFEAPSAGFILDWSAIGSIRARGADFATITHAAGISSTGDETLDALLPFDEPYEIPPVTAALIADSRRRGGRVIAIGTTVVRALEHAATRDGMVRPGCGVATERIGRRSRLSIVDIVVSGVHDAGTSHYELLRAFQNDAALETMGREAEARGYLTHEFGDSVLIARRARNPEQVSCPSWFRTSTSRRTA